MSDMGRNLEAAWCARPFHYVCKVSVDFHRCLWSGDVTRDNYLTQGTLGLERNIALSMNMRIVILLGSTALLAALAARSTVGAAQVPPLREPIAAVSRPPIRLINAVDDQTGEVIPGVEVFEESANWSFLTSSTGSANLGVIAPDGGKIHLRKIGFEEQTLTVTMAPADTAPITIRMKRVAKLPAVVTTNTAPNYLSPLLRAFEERRKTSATGYFIDEAALRKDDTRPLGSVLASHVAGSIVKPVSSANFLVKAARCSGGGQPDVYMNGVLMAHMEDSRWKTAPKLQGRNAPAADLAEYPFDLNQFQVQNLAGVEYYPDNTMLPVQFNRGRGCGALLLWTRER